MRSAMNLVVVALLLTLAGCTSVRTSEKASVEWTGPKRDLGRVVLLQQIDRVGPEKTRAQKTQDAEQAARDALTALPGTEVVDPAPFESALRDGESWTRMSDHEAILAAQAAGVDSVCVIDVDEFTGILSIGFNPLPGWWTRSNVKYHLRLIDARDGKLVTDTRRARCASRWLGLAIPVPTSDMYATDLRELLEIQ